MLIVHNISIFAIRVLSELNLNYRMIRADVVSALGPHTVDVFQSSSS